MRNLVRQMSGCWMLLLVGVAIAMTGCAHQSNGKTSHASGDIDTTSLEGKAAPNFSLSALDGRKFKLSGEKGKVVLLDYWATWCPPCQVSLPHIQEMSEDHSLAEKGLKVFAINDQESEGDVVKFVKEKNFTFNVLLDTAGDFGNVFLVQSIPTTVIIGRDGVIKKVFVGYGPDTEDQIKDAVNKALDEKSTS